MARKRQRKKNRKAVARPVVGGALALAKPGRLPAQPSKSIPWGVTSLFDRFTSHPGHGLTPRKILSIMRDAEDGYPADQCDLFEDVIERDGHLRDALEGRLEAVSGKEWIFQAGGDRTEDIRVTELLGDIVRDIPSVDDAIEHLLTANWYGYAAVGIEWGRVNGVTAPVWLECVPHRRFVFDSQGQPRLANDTGDKDAGIVLEPGRWIFHHRRHRQIARAGLMRTATWWSFFKSISVRDWIIFAEKFGVPFIRGVYNASSGNDQTADEEKAVLKEAVEALGKDGAAVLSDTCEIVIDQVRAGGDANGIHGAIVNVCNAEISKLITGATLTTETQGPGSFALGRVHQDRSFDKVQGDATKLGARFERSLGRSFVGFNGFVARPPRMKIHTVREIDPAKRAGIMSTMANELGLELDEEQVRQEFQLKKPTGSALRGTKSGVGAAPEPAPPAE